MPGYETMFLQSYEWWKAIVIDSEHRSDSCSPDEENIDKKPHLCDMCDEAFIHLDSLIAHRGKT